MSESARVWEDEGGEEKPRDPQEVAKNVQAAIVRLKGLAAEARELYAVVGDGYAFSKSIRPMARRYEWREAAGMGVFGKDEELRFAARWAGERATIEKDMGVPAMAWSPRAILTAYGSWQAKRGKRRRKLEIHDHIDRIPRLYVLDEVEREHPGLATTAIAAARKAASAANGGVPDFRLMIAAFQSAMDQTIREYATSINMDGGTVDVGGEVKRHSAAQRRAYQQDGDEDDF